MIKENALYAGCLVTARFPEYELSAKLVLEAIGIKTHPLPEAMCCSQVLQGTNPNWIYMAGYNLALAEQNNMDLITLCGGCTNTLKRVQFMCRQNPETLADINRVLKRVDLHLNNTVKTQHILEVLHEHKDAVSARAKKLLPLKAAVMIPCQVFRPAAVMQFDDADHPRVMEELVKASASNTVPYSLQNNCCGASLTLSNPEAAYKIGRARLEELEQKNTDVIITACGNCHLLLERRQSEYYGGRKIPCLFLPQLLGLAMGFSLDEMMVNDSHLRSLLSYVLFLLKIIFTASD
jgi:heterodisulfide reductase subunit B